MDENKIYAVWLNSVNGVGPKLFKKLVDYFETPKNVYNSGEEEIKYVVNNKKISNNIILQKKQNPYLYIERLLKEKINVYMLTEDDYPKMLKEIYDAPTIIYVKGNLKKSDDIALAMVGSRNATAYGRYMANELSYNIAKHGITVVSGLARGIDSSSHIGALKANGRTIAVLGSGINVIYPVDNRKLYYEIIENGAIISEYPLDMGPVAGNFPARNRIISGLSLGVVVVEAGIKSGSLITAKFALEQGRDVFAVPGSILSAYSKGTNKLIKDGAKLVTDVNDILEEYNFREDIKIRINDQIINTLDSDERKLYNLILNSPRSIDEIISILKYPISKVNYLLSSLILKGLITRLPGNRYEKNYDKL